MRFSEPEAAGETETSERRKNKTRKVEETEQGAGFPRKRWGYLRQEEELGDPCQKAMGPFAATIQKGREGSPPCPKKRLLVPGAGIL